MKYKIKEVSKITNIPIDTLRYYEKIGVISPKIDEQNHYRYYDAWDINFLLDYIIYRKMEYSSQEVVHFIHNASLKEQRSKIQEKQAYYESKRKNYHLLCQRNSDILTAIDKLEEKLKQINIEKSKSYRYIVHRHNYQYDQLSLFDGVMEQWLHYYQYIENIVFIPQNNIENELENVYHWGMAITDDYFQALNLPSNDFVKTIPEATCITTVIDAGEQGAFHYQLLDFAMDYIKKHNFQLAGEPYGILLMRSNDDTGFHRYIKFYLPIVV